MHHCRSLLRVSNQIQKNPNTLVFCLTPLLLFRSNISLEDYGSALTDPTLQRKVKNGDSDVDAFMTIMAVCHTVVPEVDPQTGEIAYQASSPGESPPSHQLLQRRPSCILRTFSRRECTREGGQTDRLQFQNQDAGRSDH